ncbi:hypothetical protein [Bilophila sp.]|uniref:hypothetical protein n=1 Tax=Bilophila sp. TaxID=1929485 RepID=UPI0030778B0D
MTGSPCGKGVDDAPDAGGGLPAGARPAAAEAFRAVGGRPVGGVSGPVPGPIAGRQPQTAASGGGF